MNNFNNKEIIKSISYNQFEILYNILNLYNNGNSFDCDPTYSKGGFYENSNPKIEKPIFKFDVFPIGDDVQKIEPLGKWPLSDNSIESINIDLPFVILPHNAKSIINKNINSNKIYNRFSGYYPKEELFNSYQWFIKESFRVLKPGGICVWKTQRTISGGVTLMTPEYSFIYANNAGFYTIDRFTLIAKNRILGKMNKQEHSRSFDSQFYVFKKPDGTSKTKQVNFLK